MAVETAGGEGTPHQAHDARPSPTSLTRGPGAPPLVRGEQPSRLPASGGDPRVAAPSSVRATTGAPVHSNEEPSEDEESGDEVSSVRAESEGEEARRERWAQRRLQARGRMHSAAESAAITIMGYAMWRQIRKLRRSKAETAHRFQFRTVPRPTQDRPATEACNAFYDEFPELRQQPPLPTEPPEPEPEAKGASGGVPDTLPRTREWWENERQRQSGAPFKAGNVATVNLEFETGMRPVPPPNHIFVWGPQLVLSKVSPEDRHDLLRILMKDLRAGGCEPVSWDQVDVVTPIHLVRHPVTMKPRITHDSRAVNVRLKDASAEMARAADALLRGNVAAKLDLLMAFRHVGLAEGDRRVLAFTINGVPFRWNALTFGCSQSPQLFQQALAKTIRTITLPGGATVIVYVDDLLVVAADAESLDQALRHICEQLTAAGWYVALDKLYPYAMTRAPFLGLIVDLANQVLRVSRVKAEKLSRRCAIIIEKRKATLSDLQKVGGVLAFLHEAAPEAGLCRSGINAATAEAERLPGRTVVVKGELAENLTFWRDSAELLPDLTRPTPGADSRVIDVATDAAGLPSLAFGGIVWPGAAPTPDIEEVMGEAATWAANPRDGETVGGGEAYASPFALNASAESSAALEVRALRVVLARYVAKHGPQALRHTTVRWFCDSQAATISVSKWRAKAVGLARECRRLLEATRGYGCSVQPHWVSRESGWQPVADALSKVRWHRDTPEWQMQQPDVTAACAAATRGAWDEPAVDLFATEGATVATQWVSRWPEAGNLWTDAFARPWNNVPRAWAFPPFSVAEAALRHLCSVGRGGMDVVVVVPRTVAVPARLRDCVRVQLPPRALVDITGRTAPGPCPVDLDAIHVAS